MASYVYLCPNQQCRCGKCSIDASQPHSETATAAAAAEVPEIEFELGPPAIEDPRHIVLTEAVRFTDNITLHVDWDAEVFHYTYVVIEFENARTVELTAKLLGKLSRREFSVHRWDAQKFRFVNAAQDKISFTMESAKMPTLTLSPANCKALYDHLWNTRPQLTEKQERDAEQYLAKHTVTSSDGLEIEVEWKADTHGDFMESRVVVVKNGQRSEKLPVELIEQLQRQKYKGYYCMMYEIDEYDGAVTFYNEDYTKPPIELTEDDIREVFKLIYTDYKKAFPSGCF